MQWLLRIAILSYYHPERRTHGVWSVSLLQCRTDKTGSKIWNIVEDTPLVLTIDWTLAGSATNPGNPQPTAVATRGHRPTARHGRGQGITADGNIVVKRAILAGPFEPSAVARGEMQAGFPEAGCSREVVRVVLVSGCHACPSARAAALWPMLCAPTNVRDGCQSVRVTARALVQCSRWCCEELGGWACAGPSLG